MNEMKRFQKLLIALNEYMDSYSYYDVELDDTVIDGDENDCYNVIMQDTELHLLTSETVRKVIHICYTDWESFDKMCRQFKAY